jgi:hypothetical protein
MRVIAVVDQPVEDRLVIRNMNVGPGLESTMAGARVPVEQKRLARPFLVAWVGDVARDLPLGWPANTNTEEEA